MTTNVFKSSTIYGILRNSDNTTASPNILANAIFDRNIDVSGNIIADRINSKTGRIDMSGNIIDISGNTIYLGHTGANVYIKDVLYGGGDVTLAGTNAFTGSNSFNTNLPTSTLTPTTSTQLITKAYGDANYTNATGDVTLAGTNAFTGTNSFNTNLPTSTLTPTTSTQLITKAYGDANYTNATGDVTLAGTNAFTGSNSFNTNLPTSTLTPTTSTQLITKTYADTIYAPKASPTFTGIPAADTAALGTNTTQLATTAFVIANSSGGSVSLAGSNVYTGTNTFNTNLPTSTLTPSSNTQLSTKKYVDDQFESHVNPSFTYWETNGRVNWYCNSTGSTFATEGNFIFNPEGLIYSGTSPADNDTGTKSSYFTIATIDYVLRNFLKIATASSTYQTIAGMSSYLTSATASSTYQTIAGMSSYLTSATASSTYQTISNMVNYVTIASTNIITGINFFTNKVYINSLDTSTSILGFNNVTTTIITANVVTR